jgi:SMODS domain-containing protein
MEIPVGCRTRDLRSPASDAWRVQARERFEMAYLLPQFEEALENIEPSKDDKENAPKAHEEVRAILDRDEKLSNYGIDTILIGSYARHVSIRRMRDVDVFSKLPKLPKDVDPDTLQSLFVDALLAELDKERVEPQERTVQVLFPDHDLYVDVVPARPRGHHWEIPDRPERGGGWEETNPERLAELTSKENDAHDELYVPTVKLIRQTRRANLDDQPPGYYFEVLTYRGFDSGDVTGSNIAEYYCSALHGVVTQLEVAIEQGLADPTIEGALISTQASTEQLKEALETFRTVTARADEALGEEDRCRAAMLFRDLLGKNSEGETVFPIPEDCNEDGSKRSTAVIAGDRHVPAGDRRFA